MMNVHSLFIVDLSNNNYNKDVMIYVQSIDIIKLQNNAWNHKIVIYIIKIMKQNNIHVLIIV